MTTGCVGSAHHERVNQRERDTLGERNCDEYAHRNRRFNFQHQPVRARGGRTAVAPGLTAFLDRIPAGPVAPLGYQNIVATRV